MTDIIGVEDNTGLTEWTQLKKLCSDHDATLTLRAETFDDFRFSLAAKDRNGKLIHDVRMNANEHAPQFVVTQMVNQALAEWWQS